MATGDQQDIWSRLRAYLPRSDWFGDGTPVLDAITQGFAYAFAFVFSLIVYARAQTRILTASDGWLDMIAADFFGASLQRSANQSDASFRNAIIVSLIRERGTRNGIITVLTQLTGKAPIVVEPTRPADTGAYGGPTIGYSAAGAYGSLLLPYQCFVRAFRPVSTGIPNVAGYGISTGGYGQASQADYASYANVLSSVSDAQIYAAIDNVKPAGTVVWTQLN